MAVKRLHTRFPMKMRTVSEMEGSCRSSSIRSRTRLPTGYPHGGRQRAGRGTPPPRSPPLRCPPRSTVPGEPEERNRTRGVGTERKDFHGCACTDRRRIGFHMKIPLKPEIKAGSGIFICCACSPFRGLHEQFHMEMRTVSEMEGSRQLVFALPYTGFHRLSSWGRGF